MENVVVVVVVVVVIVVAVAVVVVVRTLRSFGLIMICFVNV